MSTPQFYDVDSSRIPVRDLIPGAKNAWQYLQLLLLLPLFKLLRVKVPVATEAINAHELAPFRTGSEQFEPVPRAFFDDLHPRMLQLGFEPVAWYQAKSPRSSADYDRVLYCSADRQTLGIVQQRVWHFETPPRVSGAVHYVSGLPDGTVLRSSDVRPDLTCIKAIQTRVHPQASAEQLYAEHRSALGDRPAQPLADHAAAVALQDRLHALERDASLTRRIYLDPDDPAQIQASVALPEPYEQSPNAPVLRELIKQESRKWSLTATLTLLAITVGIFVIGGAAIWTVQFVAMVVVILFIHELGHLLAMKLFGYRDVKMFFIPFLGAAVTGRPVRVAAWKKVVVFLAGPIPGIVLGAAAVLGAYINGQEWLWQLAMLAIILNAINLLPVLPLDGGRVVELLLTSRHPMADLIFRIATVALLGLAYLVLQSWVLLFLAIIMAIGITHSYKIAAVAEKLRRAGPLPSADDGYHVPLPAADLICTHIKQALPKGLNASNTAKYITVIYDRITQRPPGALLTSGFLVFQAATLGIVLVGSLLLYLYGMPGSGNAFDLAARQPAYAYDPAQVQRWPAANRGDPAAARVTLVAVFDDAPAAQAVALNLKAQAPDSASLVQIGSVLLVELPADQPAWRTWLDQLEAAADPVLVHRDTLAVGFQVSGVATSDDHASQISDAFNQAVSIHWEAALLPPWHPATPPSAEQVSARRSYQQLDIGGYDDPEADSELEQQIEQWSEDVFAATRRGDDALRQQRVEQITRARDEIESRRLARAVAESPDPIHPRVLSMYAQQPTLDWSRDAEEQEMQRWEAELKSWREEMAALFGRCAEDDLYRGLALSTGYAEHGGQIVFFNYAGFDRPAMGLPELLAWLDAQGCVLIHFEPIDLNNPETYGGDY